MTNQGSVLVTHLSVCAFLIVVGKSYNAVPRREMKTDSGTINLFFHSFVHSLGSFLC